MFLGNKWLHGSLWRSFVEGPGPWDGDYFCMDFLVGGYDVGILVWMGDCID